jgi:hypothetical protein
MCVGHNRRHIIWRVIVYSCAQDKLISSRRCFLFFLFLVPGRSHVIALRRSHNMVAIGIHGGKYLPT